MGKPTVIDDENALMYAVERSKLGIFNKYLRLYPHLFSWAGVEIRHNRNIRYKSFTKNISVRLVGTEKFCQQAHCVSTYPRGKTCNPSTEPLVYKSGNSTIDACQPGCFSFFRGERDVDGNYYKMPLLRINKNAECCTLHNNIFFTQATDDYTRTDDHPTARVDTIGTGFDIDEDDSYKEGYDETFKFKMNKYYCDDFRYEFTGDDCTPSLGEKLATLFASGNLYKAVQYGARKIQSGEWLDDVQNLNLGSPDHKATSTMEWFSDVNPNAHFFNMDLTLEDLGITEEHPHLIFTTEFGWPGKLIEPTILYQTVLEKRNENRPEHLRYDNQCWRLFDEFEIMGYNKLIRELNSRAKKDEPEGVTDPAVLDKVLRAFLAQLASAEFYTEQLPAMMVNEIATILKKIVKYSSAKFTGVCINAMRLAEKTILVEFARVMGMGALRGGLMLSRLLTSTLKAVSIVGMIFDFLSLADLFFLLGDVWGAQKFGGKAMVDEYSRMDLQANLKQYGFKTFEFNPVMFIAMHDNIMKEKIENLDTTEGIGIKLLSNKTFPYSSTNSLGYTNVDMFRWQTDYLIDLEYNSIGEKIDWDPVMNFQSYEEQIDKLFNIPLYEYKGEFFQSFLKRKNVITILLIMSIIFAILMIFYKKAGIASLFCAISGFTVALTPS